MSAPHMTAPQPVTPLDAIARQVLAMREQCEAILLSVEALRQGHALRESRQPREPMADPRERRDPLMPPVFMSRLTRPDPTPEPSDRSPDDDEET